MPAKHLVSNSSQAEEQSEPDGAMLVSMHLDRKTERTAKIIDTITTKQGLDQIVLVTRPLVKIRPSSDVSTLSLAGDSGRLGLVGWKFWAGEASTKAPRTVGEVTPEGLAAPKAQDVRSKLGTPIKPSEIVREGSIIYRGMRDVDDVKLQGVIDNGMDAPVLFNKETGYFRLND